MKKSSVAPIYIPDEERNYKDLLKELDALRLLLLGEKREISDSDSFKGSEPDYYKNVGFFKIYSSEPQEQKRILGNRFKQDSSLAQQVFKLEGFSFEFKKNWLGNWNIDEAAGFLVKTVNKKLTLIKNTIALEKKYPGGEQLEPLSEPLNRINQDLSFLSEELRLELQQSTNDLIKSPKDQIGFLQDSVATPKKISAVKGSYSRLEQKKESSEEEGKRKVFEELPIRIQEFSQSFSNIVDTEKKKEAILKLTELGEIFSEDHKKMLEQFEKSSGLIKHENDEALKNILKQIQKIHLHIQELIQNQNKIDVFPEAFVQEKQSSLEALVKKLEDALAPYNTLISSLESRKSEVETFYRDMKSYLSNLQLQDFEASSIAPLHVSLLSARNLIVGIEKSLTAPFSAGFETLEGLNKESVPDFSEMISQVKEKTISSENSENSVNIDEFSSILDLSTQEKEDMQSDENEDGLNISNETGEDINEDDSLELEKELVLENMEKNKSKSDQLNNEEEITTLPESTSGQSKIVENEEKQQSLSLVKAPVRRGSQFPLMFTGAALLFGVFGGAVVLRNKYPDSIPGSIPDAVDAVRKMCGIQ